MSNYLVYFIIVFEHIFYMDFNSIFIFSDESGKYESNNFYIRTLLFIDVSKYKDLMIEFIDLKKKYRIPLDKEFKFSYIWSLKILKNKEIVNKSYSFFNNYDLTQLINFVRDSIILLNKYSPKIIVVYTYFVYSLFKTRSEIEFDFMKTLMLRIEDSCKSTNSFATIYYDDCDSNKSMRQAYSDIFSRADYVNEYKNIKDSISFEDSNYSTGIQLTDFVSGIIHNTFKNSIKEYKNNNYNFSEELFNSFILNWFRRVKGYDINKTGCIQMFLSDYGDITTKIDLLFSSKS